MIRHPVSLVEHLEPAESDSLYEAALRILQEVGLVVQSPEACEAAVAHGATMANHRVRFPSDLVERALETAPCRWQLHARNPARTVDVGAPGLLVCPGYGSPFVADRMGRRRNATLEDFRAFATLAGQSKCIDLTGGLLVEPMEISPALRPLETTLALIECSDKPFLGSVAGASGARESIDLARIAFAEIEKAPVMMGLININSPLRLDQTMAGALVEYVRAGQAVLLTPGIMMGITAPVTSAGAMAQALAELAGCVAIVQSLRPGAPVMIGTGGFGSDLRTGGPGFGRPENALATVVGAQMARRLGLPYRCSGGVTGSFLPDCRSGYERMMTAMAAWTSGAHLCLQGAGTLDCINSMSYEQFAIDLEMWGYITRLSQPPEVTAQGMAVDLVCSTPGDYLGSEHTVAHMREELFQPELAVTLPYEQWIATRGPAEDGPDVTVLADQNLEGLTDSAPPPMEPGLLAELERYAATRRAALG